MKFLPTALPGRDRRRARRAPGQRAASSWRRTTSGKYREGGIAGAFVQDNHSRSVRGTLRGLHAQVAAAAGQAGARGGRARCSTWRWTSGRGSPTFGRWVGVALSGENFRQLYIPPGFAHGFCVLSPEVGQVEYKCTELYDAADEIAIAWNDPDIGIEWPVTDPMVSAKDRARPAAGRDRWTGCAAVLPGSGLPVATGSDGSELHSLQEPA